MTKHANSTPLAALASRHRPLAVAGVLAAHPPTTQNHTEEMKGPECAVKRPFSATVLELRVLPCTTCGGGLRGPVSPEHVTN
ncbi:hypothetical protein SKAU_G00169380 [Synaphobranchus kaupii]|uniref:Uncharacterized protein n=1 Tax=Synaphobranchus kaupii TaxID=118154 RepID=A0A9Q1FK22_SYNKA|nr:hypothetical protein SKAU_G00169380 [Synaphobranchus kaupii]